MSRKLLAEQFPCVLELGIKIEKVGGLTVWEAHSVLAHQVAVVRTKCGKRVPSPLVSCPHNSSK